MFTTYYKEVISKTKQRSLNNYKGILRKDYPRWIGWKILLSYKEKGVHASLVQDELLDILVENHYYLKYLESTYLK